MSCLYKTYSDVKQILLPLLLFQYISLVRILKRQPLEVRTVMKGEPLNSFLGAWGLGMLSYSWQSKPGGPPRQDHRTTGFQNVRRWVCTAASWLIQGWAGMGWSRQERTLKEQQNCSQMTSRALEYWETQLSVGLPSPQKGLVCLKGPRHWV